MYLEHPVYTIVPLRPALSYKMKGETFNQTEYDMKLKIGDQQLDAVVTVESTMQPWVMFGGKSYFIT